MSCGKLVLLTYEGMRHDDIDVMRFDLHASHVMICTESIIRLK